jgi:transposase InsO family protein
MGLARRRPDHGLIHHSDQGSQFVSLAFGQKARDAGIAVSMGSKGDCYDNAVAESFFATLKKELVHRRTWPTCRELTSEVFEYIEAFYNNSRRHSTLGYLSPAVFEEVALPTNNKNTKLPAKAQPCPERRGNSTRRSSDSSRCCWCSFGQ